MIILRSQKNDLLIPLFTIIIFMLSLAAPLKDYIGIKTTNTDALRPAATKSAISEISAPEKAPAAEIAVPKLGAIDQSTTPIQNTTKASAIAASSSACPDQNSAPYNTISICGRLIPIQLSAGTMKNATPPSGIAVQNTIYNVLYGHNSYDVFGGLYGLLAPGNQFAVNINGITITYTVSSIFTINTDEQFATAVGRLYYSRRATASLGIITCAPGVTYNAATNTTSSQDRVLILATPSPS